MKSILIRHQRGNKRVVLLGDEKLNISGFTEEQAREKIGEQKCRVLDYYKFWWSEQLTYSGTEGWTNGFCSFNFDEDIGLDQTDEQMVEHILKYGKVISDEN